MEAAFQDKFSSKQGITGDAQSQIESYLSRKKQLWLNKALNKIERQFQSHKSVIGLKGVKPIGSGVYGLAADPTTGLEDRIVRSNSQVSHLAPLKHSLSGLLQNSISVASDSRNIAGIDSNMVEGNRSEDQLMEGLSLM